MDYRPSDPREPDNPCDSAVCNHYQDSALMFQCPYCEEWHLTHNGERMDFHYWDVLPQKPYTWHSADWLPF